jgi:hypothetical protein
MPFTVWALPWICAGTGRGGPAILNSPTNPDSGLGRISFPALAQEQDIQMREDRARLEARRKKMKGFNRDFSRVRKKWAQNHSGLLEQHRDLLGMAGSLVE